MSHLLYIDIKNHQNIKHITPQLQILEPSHHKDNIKQNKLLLDPQSIYFNFQSQKTNVEKLTLQNNYNYKISFKIQQPKKSIFTVKSKKSSLNPKQTCQIYLFFAGQKQKVIIQDEFIIILDKQKTKLHIPIICRPKVFRSSNRKLSLRKTSLLKQNQTQIKQKVKPTKPLTLKKRKTGPTDFNGQVENMITFFMEKFNSIHQFVKQKNVKKQIFIGQKALSDQKHKKIISFNQKVKRHIQISIRKKVQSRLEPQFSQQGPVIRNFQGVILRWNKQKNIPRMIYEKGLAKVQQQVRRYLVNLRFEKIHRIFSLYRQFQKSNQHSNLPTHKKHEIYIQRLQKKINKKSQISLQLTFDRNSIIGTNIQIQNEIYSSRKNHIFEINPRIGFDNWVAIEQSIPYTHQLMDYSKKQSIPQWLCHPKLQQNHLGSFTGGHLNSKNISSDWKDMQQNSSELDFIMSLLRLNTDDNQEQKQLQQQVKNNRQRTNLLMKNDIKINEAFNLTNKIFSSVFSIKNTNQLSNSDHFRKSQQTDNNQTNQQIQNIKIKSKLNYIMRNKYQQKIFSTYINQLNQNNYKSQQQLVNEEKFIINDLSKYRYNMDYLNSICCIKQESEDSQQNKKFYIDWIAPYKNQILRKIPKQDKYQFDRLDNKAQHILTLINQYQKQQQLHTYRIKGQIDLQIPNKNKIKTYSIGSVNNQQYFQNIHHHKIQLLGKSNSLQVYLHQTSKNKNHSIVIG